MRQGPDSKDQNGAIHNREANVWTAPFVMAAINSRIVRRTNALLNYQYGKEFRYAEATITGSGLKGWLRAITISIGLKLSIIAAAIPAIRRIVIEPKVPKPGEGPSSEEQKNGYFNLLMIAKLTDGKILRLHIKGDRDPGYGSTSKMLAESAICLAKDRLSIRGGIWTPAAAMGNSLLQRMQNNAGLTFDLE